MIKIFSRVFFFPFLFIFGQPVLFAGDCWKVEVVSKKVHDTEAYTQGLAFSNPYLYESTGLYGKSSMRITDIRNGQTEIKPMPEQVFAEGIAALPHKLIQLSWKEGKAFYYNRHSLCLYQVVDYRGEGWGLCADGDTVWMSDGTSTLYQREAKTFAIIKKLKVKIKGKCSEKLNDLECVGDYLYVNVWQTDLILKVHKKSGAVDAIIDVSHLLTEEEKSALGTEDVLNGIAFKPKTETFFLTGKRWPWIFEVRIFKD